MSIIDHPPAVPERAEVAAAFEHFLDLGARGRDWPSWAGVFTADAVYTEHCLGRYVGADAIRSWIVAAMEPVACMTFSVEWFVIDGPLLSFWIWNHLPDPSGEGREFAFPNLSILEYAGDHRWRSEEDFYDPAWAEGPVGAWFRSGGRPGLVAQPALRPRTPSHPRPPDPPPPRPVVDAVLSAMVEPGWRERTRVVEGGVGVLAVDTDERPVAFVVHVDHTGATTFVQRVENPREHHG
jgi:SnoaL-like domain